MMSITSLFVMVLLAAISLGDARSSKRDDLYRAYLHKRRVSLQQHNPQYPSPRFFTQDQDHFDGTNTNQWQQAYYVNDTFNQKDDPNAPVFLCVGGEGPPLDGSAVVASVHCNDAVELMPSTGAIMFAVEHRYYGCHNMSACPVSNFSNVMPSLKYLSSRQALADLVSFHAYAVKAYGLGSRKWVSFGGSYPGMLSSWFRLKFPHLAHASVSSSAPVRAIVDMRGYNDVTAYAYTVSDNGVGGSPLCADAIRIGHATIGKLFNTSDGRQRLANLFGNTPDWYASYVNQGMFAGGGVAYFPSQMNDPSCTDPSCSIGLICQVMTNTSIGDEVSRLAEVLHQQSLWFKEEGSLAKKDPQPDFWGYQTCTEFGFYQTCEIGSQCFYTQGYDTLESQEIACQLEFGISNAKVAENVAYSNAYYGAGHPDGTCVLYVNGEVDPWNSQSILSPPSAKLPTLFVPGASHHFWTHPTLPTDQRSVVLARESIWKYVKSILRSDC